MDTGRPAGTLVEIREGEHDIGRENYGYDESYESGHSVIGDRFGSTEEDVARAIQALKTSTQAVPSMTEPSMVAAATAS